LRSGRSLLTVPGKKSFREQDYAPKGKRKTAHAKRAEHENKPPLSQAHPDDKNGREGRYNVTRGKKKIKIGSATGRKILA